MKTCTKCGGLPQPKENFYRNAMSSDGLQSWCKECSREAVRLRGWHKPTRKLTSNFIRIDTVIAPPMEAQCDYGDIRGTKMWNNRHFVSGDGGYKNYIQQQNLMGVNS